VLLNKLVINQKQPFCHLCELILCRLDCVYWNNWGGLYTSLLIETTPDQSEAAAVYWATQPIMLSCVLYDLCIVGSHFSYVLHGQRPVSFGGLDSVVYYWAMLNCV